MTLGGKRLTLQAVGDGFDLVYEGTMFNVLWEQEKRKNAFTWQNKDRKHDAFEVHTFGENVDRVVQPTTRDRGTKHAQQMAVMNRETLARREEQKGKGNGEKAKSGASSDP